MDIFNISLDDIDSNISALLCELNLENYTIFCMNHSPQPLKGGKETPTFLKLADRHASEPLSDDFSFLFSDLNQTVRILLYALIFLLGVLGNTLVIIVLIRTKRMRTVTNIFLLSLAISDLMLCFFCMPFTLIPNLLQDFIFGSAFCKITSYFMGELMNSYRLDSIPFHISSLPG
ncbi:Cholecystokinin receptor type A [Varanus komodoensis]|nr:Cholecystokinin receptor type A [Varanus komodoensis]